MKDPFFLQSARHRPMKGKFYVSLEGNIGAGKSTVLGILPRTFNRIKEPVDQYSKFGSHNGFATQMYIITTSPRYYVGEIMSSVHQINVSERSMLSPLVFVKARSDSGDNNQFATDLLLAMFDAAVADPRNGQARPHHMIYLSTDPCICFERLKMRGEKYPIPLDYLKDLHKQMESYYLERTDVSVIKVNRDMDANAVRDAVQAAIEKQWELFAGAAVVTEE